MPRPDPSTSDADALIDAVIDREGRYVNHPADRGGPTCWGITEAVARAQGYAGAMRDLPRTEAASIYRRLYWLRPGFDKIALRAPKIAAELFDTGVNMGTGTAAAFLQRALNALNRAARLSALSARWRKPAAVPVPMLTPVSNSSAAIRDARSATLSKPGRSQ